MPLARAAFLFWQDSFPAGEVLALDLLLFVVGREAALHGDFGRLVAVEEGCVDLDAGDFAGRDAEAEDYPVEGLCVVASCLPAVIPCSCVGEDAGFADWGLRVVEILCGGEPFVGEGEDARSEVSVYEVLQCQVVATIIIHIGGRHTYAVTERLVDRLGIDLLDIRHVEQRPKWYESRNLSVYGGLSLCRSTGTQRVFILFGGALGTPPR